MSFPMPPNPAQPIIVITADDRFDELHTLSCSGTDITPNKALVLNVRYYLPILKVLNVVMPKTFPYILKLFRAKVLYTVILVLLTQIKIML
jgi:hypothetical protein